MESSIWNISTTNGCDIREVWFRDSGENLGFGPVDGESMELNATIARIDPSCGTMNSGA